MLKVSLPYKYKHPLMDEQTVSQFDIKYDSKKNDFGKLIHFIEQFPHKRINISLTSSADLENIRVINKIHKNIYLKFDDLNIISNFKEDDDFKYYFSFAIGNYTQLNQILSKFSVSDIYIADDLCYDLKKVKEICDIYKIKIRLIVNKIPSFGLKGFSVKDPIFRPDDEEYLSQFINVIEFDCNNDWHKIEVLYKAWIEQNIWFGNLQEINSDIHFYFPNKQIIDYLYINKYNCNLGCIKGTNCTCCEDIFRLAQTADEKNLIYKNKKGAE